MNVETLLQQLEEKNEKLDQAGKYGKFLLDTRTHIENQLDQANQEYEKKCEELEQFKYNTEMKLEASKTCEEQIRTNWLDEKKVLVEDHRKELEIQQNCHKEALAELSMKITDLQKYNEEKFNINEQQKEKIKTQQASISELRISLQKKTVNNSFPEMEELAKENADLYEQLTMTKEDCSDTKNEIERLKWQMKDLEKSNEYFREEKENIRIEMASCSEALAQTQQDNFSLAKELADLRTQPQDLNSRGNSLFAEVEDRRVQAEKKLISSQVKLKCMEKKFSQQVNYSMKLKSQIAQLLQTGGRDADRERISRLEHALASSQCDVELRNGKVTDLEKKLASNLSETVSEMKKGENTDGEFVGFLENLLKKKDTEISKLSKELQKCHIDLLAESRKLNDAEVDVYSAQNERDKLKAQTVKLKMEVTRLKMKCGEDVQGVRNVKPRKVEKISTTDVLSDSTSIDTNNENIPYNHQEINFVDSSETAALKKKNLNSKIEEEPSSSKHGLKQCPEECRQQ